MFGSRSVNQDIKKGYNCLYSGDYKNGFRLVEARHPNKYPLGFGEKTSFHKAGYWHSGVSVKGKDVAIMHEGGRGDVIHFIRYVKMLPQLEVKSITLIMAPEMIPLINRLGYPCKNVPGNEPVDLRIWVMSLPALLLEHGLFPETVPKKHYLSEGYLKNESLTNINDKVGICWYTNSGAWNKQYRQIPHELVQNLIKKYDTVDFVPLQMESTFLPRYFEVANNMAVSADKVQQLKAVITIDTSVLHLAGALGVKTYGLVGSGTNMDWRWLPEQRRTAWYDSITCIYNDPANNWQRSLETALEEVCR